MTNYRVTLKQIAEVAGVHHTTVSLVLRNDPRIPGKTKDRILAIAKEMKYYPDPAMAALISYRKSISPVRYHSTIGFLSPFPLSRLQNINSTDSQKWASWKRFHSGAGKFAEAMGYRLEEIWTKEPGMTSKRCGEILYHKNIRGIIVGPQNVAHGHLRLNWDSFCSVSAGYSLAQPPLHRVAPDCHQSILLCVRQLRKLGYRRIGLALPKEENEVVNRKWLAGFVAAQASRENGSNRILLPDNWDRNTFLYWYKEEKPDVIISIYLSVLEWLKEAKIRVPEEVGFANLESNDRMGNYAGINQNWKTLGATTVQFLVANLHQNSMGIPTIPISTFISGSWVNGRTVRRIN